MDDRSSNLKNDIDTANRCYQAGEFITALMKFRCIATEITLVGPARQEWKDYEILCIDRMVDLSILSGATGAATKILRGMIGIFESESNKFAVNLSTIRLVQLEQSLGDDEVRNSTYLLASMLNLDDPDNLFCISQTEHRLEDFESQLRRPSQSDKYRPELMARFYLALGACMHIHGRFGNAIHWLTLGEKLASLNEMRFTQTISGLRLALAEAYFALGNFPACAQWLRECQSVKSLGLPLSIRCWAQTVELQMVLGRYGDALLAADQLLEACVASQFNKPRAEAHLYVAEILILLCQTRFALRQIELAEEVAGQVDKSVADRAGVLRELARRRLRSPVEGATFIPSVYNNWVPATPKEQPEDPGTATPVALLAPSDFLSKFSHLASQVHWMLSMGDVCGAYSKIKNTRAAFSMCDSPLLNYRLTVLKGVIYYHQGEYEEATKQLKKGIEGLDQLGLREAWQAKAILSLCLSQLDRPQEEISKLAIEIQRARDELESSLNTPEASILYRLSGWGINERYRSQIDDLKALKNRATKQAWPLKLVTRIKVMVGLNRLLDELDRKSHMPDTAMEPIRVTALWQRLLLQPRRKATAYYVTLTDQVVLIQSRFMWLDFTFEPCMRGALLELVGIWHELLREYAKALNGRKDRKKPQNWEGFLDEPAGRDRKNTSASDMHFEVGKNAGDGRTASANKDTNRRYVEAVLHELSAALQISPLVASLPARINRLNIVPDESVLGVPFAAMRHKQKGTNETSYLIEKLALCTCLLGTKTSARARVGRSRDALSLLEALRRFVCMVMHEYSGRNTPSRLSSRYGRAGRTALLVGVSKGKRGKERDGLGKNAISEVLRVRSWAATGEDKEGKYDTCDTTIVDRKPLASESEVNIDKTDRSEIAEAVKEGLKQAHLLHMICHGRPDSDPLGRPGLELAPPEAGNTAVILTCDELAKPDLSKLEHATFQSCWVGDHFILPGWRSIGLPETLLRAGVGSVLASLWPVEIKQGVAMAFMKRFYGYLDQYPRSQALQHAQRDCIAGKLNLEEGVVNTESPLYWAGYSLFIRNT